MSELWAAPDRTVPLLTDIIPLREGGEFDTGLWKIDLATLGGLIGGSGYERTRIIPEAADFTLDNANGATITDGTYGLTLEVPTGTNGIRFVRSNTPAPGAPFRAIARMRPLSPEVGSNLYHCCMIARNSANGRIMIMGNYNRDILIQGFTSFTAYSFGLYGVGVVDYPTWLSIRVDATHIYFGCSWDGETFYDFSSDTLGSFMLTVDEIGFGCFMNGVKCVDIFQSFEVI